MRCEIVYVRFNFLHGNHVLYRSDCVLEKYDGFRREWIIKDEYVLSCIDMSQDGLINLTTLRRIAAKKSNNRTKEIIFPNHLAINNESSGRFCSISNGGITRHVLQIELRVNTVIA